MVVDSGVTGGGGGGGWAGGRVHPETSDRGIFADLPGKKRQGKNKKKRGEIGEEKKEIVKGKVEN